MTTKTKQKRISDAITLTMAILAIAAICLMAMKLIGIAAQTAVEYRLSEMRSEASIHMIETYDLSIEPDNMLYSGQNEAWVYNDIPDTEEAAETINLTVGDDTAIAESKPIEIEGVKTDWRYYITADEVRLVALIAELEDRNAMSEIAEVILNRISSPKFPDSVGEVIFQPKQFHTVGLITDDMMPSDGAVQAVEAVFRDGQSTVDEALFFAEKTVKPEKIAKGLYLVLEKGGTGFYGQQ